MADKLTYDEWLEHEKKRLWSEYHDHIESMMEAYYNDAEYEEWLAREKSDELRQQYQWYTEGLNIFGEKDRPQHGVR